MKKRNLEGLVVKSGFSQTVAWGPLVFISGQLPVDEQRRLVSDDFGEQCRQVLRNLEIALESHGCSWHEVAKINCFLTDVEDYEAFCAIREEVIPPPFPISTLVIVKDLCLAGARVEMDAMAITGEAAAAG